MRYFLLLSIVLLTAACATVETPHRGKLSDAMKVASDEHKGKRHLQVPEPQAAPQITTPQAATADTDSSTTTLAEPGESSSPDTWYKSVTLLRTKGRGFGDYDRQNGLTIRAGGEGEQGGQSEVYLGYESVSLKSRSSLQPSIDGNLLVLFAGIRLKHYFTPYSEKLRPYLAGGAGGAYMLWSYRNAFTTSEGDVIHSDTLRGFLISTAAGIEVKPLPALSVFAELNPKVYLWNEQTGRGFDNDQFDPLNAIALSLGLSLHF